MYGRNRNTVRCAALFLSAKVLCKAKCGPSHWWVQRNIFMLFRQLGGMPLEGLDDGGE